MQDYLGMLTVDPDDKLDHGVKGQKWGIRRSSAALRAAAAKRKATKATEGEKKPEGTAKKAESKTDAPAKPSGNIQDNVESSSARYARLADQAKAGKAHEMTEQDLKFFNARTEALAKVAKMNESQPGWLAATAKKVALQTAEQQVQAVSTAVANKYVSGVVIEKLGAAAKKK